MLEFFNKWLWLDLLFYKDEFQEINKLISVHPEDVEGFQNNPTNTLFECIGIDDAYLIIRSKHYVYRVRKEAVKQIIPTPKFKWYDRVSLIDNSKINAIIDDLFWNHKHQKYYYSLLIDGKKKTNRFDESELKMETAQ